MALMLHGQFYCQAESNGSSLAAILRMKDRFDLDMRVLFMANGEGLKIKVLIL